MSRCDCGVQGPHFKCKACGTHVVLSNKPCPICKYFVFDNVIHDAPETTQDAKPTPDVTPARTTTTRRAKPRAAST